MFFPVFNNQFCQIDGFLPADYAAIIPILSCRLPRPLKMQGKTSTKNTGFSPGFVSNFPLYL